MIQTPFSWFFPSCTTFSKLRECLVTSIKGTRGVIYWSEKAALTYGYFRGPTLSCIDIHILLSSEAGKPSLNSSSTSLTMISGETSGCSLPKSIISYQKKPQFTPKILHSFPQNQGLTAGLGDPCIWLYFPLIGTGTSFTTTNTVLPGYPSSRSLAAGSMASCLAVV